MNFNQSSYALRSTPLHSLATGGKLVEEFLVSIICVYLYNLTREQLPNVKFRITLSVVTLAILVFVAALYFGIINP